MMFSWFSRKGKSRSDNRDAAGILDTPKAFFALIVDGGTKGSAGAPFVKAWITTLLTELVAQPNLDVDQILCSMRHAHATIRFDYPAESACYTGLLLHHSSQRAWALTCGDCCLGVTGTHPESTDWLTPVHTLDEFLKTPISTIFTTQPESVTGHSVVTRCLNARRFTPPQIVELSDSRQKHWLLASDGYLSGYQSKKTIGEDDVSCLTVSTTLTSNIIDSDCDNLFIFPFT